MRRILVSIAIASPRPAMQAARATDRYFAADGARLRYRDEGNGPAVLLVHGWALDLAMWDALVARYAQEFRLVRLDRRGFGLSSGRPALERDVADLRGAACHLGLPRRRAARDVAGRARGTATGAVRRRQRLLPGARWSAGP